MDTLILVNKQDQEVGFANKYTTHKLGLLHRAFSIVILRKNGGTTEILLQQRAKSKYHSPGLWTNSCCSHFIPGMNNCPNERLQFEMGLTTNLEYAGKFYYKAALGDMTEHEIDYVYLGFIESLKPKINPSEVMDYKWEDFKKLAGEMLDPRIYTPWLSGVLQVVKERVK